MTTNQNYSKIVTTVNSVTQNLSIIPDQHNVIVIDTSENRLGINTINPQHCIDVRDIPDICGIIYGDHIKTNTVMSDLTPDIDICYNIGSQSNRWNRIDASYLEVTGINIKDGSKFTIGGATTGNGVSFPLGVNVDGDITTSGNITATDGNISARHANLSGIEITNSLTLQPDAIFQAKNINFSGIPNNLADVSTGYLYQDNGYIKIKP